MRARNLKPGFFKNEELATLPPLTRILFQGLWCMADRSGRMEDRPLRIKAEVLPYDTCDVDAMLDTLANFHDPFISRYEANGKRYIQVCKSDRHFNPHPNEKHSEFPARYEKLLPKVEALVKLDVPLALNPDVMNPHSLNPDVMNPDSAIRALSPKVEKEKREYRIPEPKEDPTAAVVMYYKAVKKTIPYDDRDWDKTHWSRSAKAAVAILKTCGSYESARACIDQVSADMGEKSWTLETIVRWVHEWKAKQGGKDYGATNSARFFNAVAKQRTASKFAELRAVSTAGEILDGVRDMQGLSLKTNGDNRSAGKPDDGPMASVREAPMETTTDRGQES